MKIQPGDKVRVKEECYNGFHLVHKIRKNMIYTVNIVTRDLYDGNVDEYIKLKEEENNSYFLSENFEKINQGFFSDIIDDLLL
jgi:hypothetical protein